MDSIKVFVAKGVDGVLYPVASDKIAVLEEKARAARDSGMFDGVPITHGILLDSTALFPVMKFNCPPGLAGKGKKGKG